MYIVYTMYACMYVYMYIHILYIYNKFLFIPLIVTIVGGVVFLMFALTALMFDPNEGET